MTRHPAARLWRATLRHQGRLADDGFSQIFLLNPVVYSYDNQIQLSARLHHRPIGYARNNALCFLDDLLDRPIESVRGNHYIPRFVQSLLHASSDLDTFFRMAALYHIQVICGDHVRVSDMVSRTVGVLSQDDWSFEPRTSGI